MDLVGEAQLRMDEWRRPQQGVDIRRKRGKRSSKPMLMKCGDCNRRGGEPAQKKKFRSSETRSVRRRTRASTYTKQISSKRNAGVSRDDTGSKMET